MKYLAAILICAVPSLAFAQGASPAGTGQPQAEQKPANSQAKPKQKPVSQITETKKKSASSGKVHVNPVEYDPVTGQHCSGQGAYRVCW